MDYWLSHRISGNCWAGEMADCLDGRHCRTFWSMVNAQTPCQTLHNFHRNILLSFLIYLFFLLACSSFTMLYQFLLCSKVNQSHRSPLPCISFPFRSPQSIEFPVLYSQFLLAICFINSSVYMLIPISQSIPFPFLLGIHMFVLYISVSIFALQISSSIPYSRFHIYALIYNICFSLSCLLHSV